MRVAILASGGKDSSYATWWAELQGWEIAEIVTVIITGKDSLMFQIQNTAIAGLQSASMGIPWLPVVSDGKETAEIGELEDAIAGRSVVEPTILGLWPDSFVFPPNLKLHSGRLAIDGLVVGALRSDYQKTNIEMMCQRLGIRSFCPLWHKDPATHLRSLINHGFNVVFTSVSCEGLDESWLGSTLDHSSLLKLEVLAKKHRFNLDGEGGEFETIVTGGPHLPTSVKISGLPDWRGGRGVWNMDSCRLIGNRYAQTGAHGRPV